MHSRRVRCLHTHCVARSTRLSTKFLERKNPKQVHYSISTRVCVCDCDDDVSVAFVYVMMNTATHFWLGHAAMHPNATNNSNMYIPKHEFEINFPKLKLTEMSIANARMQHWPSGIVSQWRCGKLRSNDVRRRDDHKQQFSTNKMNWQPRRHININFFDASTIRKLLLLLHQL